ncbi:MAG: glycoside hydrolase family 32 protein [Candidatus Poribacteria bacterium]|nr:glycoside hydrolase family 32 protein [Candidatus Poribacteria bacterium]
MNTSATAEQIQTLVQHARELRDRLWADRHRPRYHLLPSDGFFNDANGTIFWKGRYHVFYLGRMPLPIPDQPGNIQWLPVFDHSSSHDLVHWIQHPPAIKPAADGSTPKGIYSGDAIENAPIPTLIYHVPGQGICIATSTDDELNHWTPLPENPVIPIPQQSQEYTVFDPCAWYEDGIYHALIGNKNSRQGYEGDTTSLFISTDLINWQYRGPFYKSNRHWTDEVEDCACPDFFPLGDRHMLLMHGHCPYGMAHYYLGHYREEQFFPQIHGRMNWPGGQLSAPETLLDDKGRRIFFGWIRETRPWEQLRSSGWASVMTLPRVLSLAEDGTLGIEPVPELETLRRNHRRWPGIRLTSEVVIEEVSGDCLELVAEFNSGTATTFGLKVQRSPDGAEETAIFYMPESDSLIIDFSKSTLDKAVKYPRFTPHDEPEGVDDDDRYASAQQAPFELADGERLKLRIFLDRSVLEVFANGRQCMTQRIYPTREDSLGVSVFAYGGETTLKSLDVWEMRTTNSW